MQDAYLRSHNYVCLPRPICTNSVYLCDLSSSYQNDTYAGHSWTYSKYVAATYKWLLYKSNAFVNYISIDENAAFAWSNHLWRLGQVCERFSWHRRGQVFALFSVNWLTAHMKLTNWQADHLCVFKSHWYSRLLKSGNEHAEQQLTYESGCLFCLNYHALNFSWSIHC